MKGEFMKKLMIVSLLLGAFNVMAGEVNVKVSGMVCSMCAQGIQKKFSGQEAVQKLNFDMDQKLVTIHTHDGKEINDETITKLITEAGYNVASITRK
jgi:periplasmic mercuric ion binding protein